MLAGATLAFTTDFDSVPAIPGRWEGIDRTVYASLITCIDKENVFITGQGTLDGQGFAWWELDLTWLALRILDAVGLVHDLRPVPAAVLDVARPASRTE